MYYYADLYQSMHKIPNTELMEVNNATWIYVKVCIQAEAGVVPSSSLVKLS